MASAARTSIFLTLFTLLALFSQGALSAPERKVEEGEQNPRACRPGQCHNGFQCIYVPSGQTCSVSCTRRYCWDGKSCINFDSCREHCADGYSWQNGSCKPEPQDFKPSQP